MKETFKSYMELLVSIALDPDTMQALEKSNGTPTKHTQIGFV